MFPAGAAGCGLLILRLCAAGMLAQNSLSDATLPLPAFEFVSGSVAALFLCLGLLTPLSCVASGILQVALQSDRHACPLRLLFSLSVTAALFLLGPGAFSVDSRLFGRRLVIRSR